MSSGAIQWKRRCSSAARLGVAEYVRHNHFQHLFKNLLLMCSTFNVAVIHKRLVTNVPTPCAQRWQLPARASLFVVAHLCMAVTGCGPRLVAAMWFSAPKMPLAISEGSSGILTGPNGDGLLVVLGDNKRDKAAAAATLVLDLRTSTWSKRAGRPHIGHHIAAVTYKNKLYLIGGFLGNTTNNVQIYNPIMDTWTLGPEPLVKSGAGMATIIKDTLFYCGGLKNGNQISGPVIADCAKLDIPSNVWTRIAPMKHAVHHHAMGNDGKLVYVFGGRNISKNVPKSPVNYIQIYDPTSNTWRASTDTTGGPGPMPVGRGGMGAAVFLDGDFYLFGGETACGQTVLGSCPNSHIGLTKDGVFSLVQKYTPKLDGWQQVPPGMTTPRHGMYPVLGPAPTDSNNVSGSVVYVCGGGVKAGYSDSDVCEYWKKP